MNKRNTTVLVVDANPITLLATAGVLDSFGFECYCARNAESAKQVPRQQELDAAIIDVGHDAEAALELVTQLRDLVQYDEMPCILLADSTWAGLEKRCEALRSVRCLFKPIDPNVLGDVAQQSLWLPQVSAIHRRKGTRPTRPGWVQL